MLVCYLNYQNWLNRSTAQKLSQSKISKITLSLVLYISVAKRDNMQYTLIWLYLTNSLIGYNLR